MSTPQRFFQTPSASQQSSGLDPNILRKCAKALDEALPTVPMDWKTGRIIFREIDCFSEVPKRPSFFLNIGVLMIQSPLWSTLNIDHAWGQKQVSWRAKHVLEATTTLMAGPEPEQLSMVWWFHPKFINWNPMGNGKGILIPIFLRNAPKIPTTMGIYVPHRLGHWEDAGGTKKGHLAIYIGAFGG